MLKQQTIRKSVRLSGVGLHTGHPVVLTLRPASADTGIIFRRVDLHPMVDIKVGWDTVVRTNYATVVANDQGVEVSTIEHLMAALSAYAIYNLIIEIDGPEVPIMDGSSAPFLFLLECAGLQKSSIHQPCIKILQEMRVDTKDGRCAVIAPTQKETLTISIDFVLGQHQGTQSYTYTHSLNAFRHKIARARTFGFYEDVEKMQQAGLIKGGSLANALVLKDQEVLNPEGKRFEEECVRHKILDVVGDLFLAGAPLIGSFYGHSCGHTLNNQLLQKIFNTPNAWEYVENTHSSRGGATLQVADHMAACAY